MVHVTFHPAIPPPGIGARPINRSRRPFAGCEQYLNCEIMEYVLIAEDAIGSLVLFLETVHCVCVHMLCFV